MADERSLSELLWDYGVYAPIGLAAAIVDELPRLSDKGKARAANQIQVARLIGKMAVGQGKRHFGKVFGEQSPAATARQATSTAPSAHATRSGSSHAGSSSQAVSANGGADLAGGGTHSPRAPRQSAARSAASPTAAAAPAATRTAGAAKAPATGTAKAATGARKAATGAGTTSSARTPRQGASGGKAPSKTAAGAAVAPPAAESLAIPGYDTLAASQVVQRLSSLRPEELEAIRRYELSTRGRRTILHRIAQLAADR